MKFSSSVRKSLIQFCREEDGQDLIEYSLLMAFVALSAVGLFAGVRTQTSDLWSTVNAALFSAKTAAS